MSKNSELLQEIDSDEDLLRTVDSDIAIATSLVTVVTSTPDVDNAEHERALRNASLPDVPVPVEDSPASHASHIVGSLEPTERAAAMGLQANSAMVSPPPGGTLLDATNVPVPPAELFVNGESQRRTEQNVVPSENRTRLTDPYFRYFRPIPNLYLRPARQNSECRRVPSA